MTVDKANLGVAFGAKFASMRSGARPFAPTPKRRFAPTPKSSRCAEKGAPHRSRRRALWRAALAAVLCLAAERGAWATAGEAEAKATALAANCKPGKVEVLRQVPGGNGETVFKVECSDGKSKDVFILVLCRVRQCSMLR